VRVVAGDSDPWCISELQNAGAPLDPPNKPDFTVSATADNSVPPVEVHWREKSVFADLGHPFAYGYAEIGGETIYLNSGEQSEIDHYVLLHEIAHALGYRHGDGGVVDTDVALFPNTGDRSPDGGLAEPTRDVAQTFTGLQHIDSGEWDVSILGDLGTDFASEETGISQLGIGGEEFATVETGQREDLYFEDDYDGFGGRFTPGYQSDATNILTGRFYTEN
jgi:hypothetical protein